MLNVYPLVSGKKFRCMDTWSLYLDHQIYATRALCFHILLHETDWDLWWLQVPALARYPAPISLMAGSVFSGTILVFLTVVMTVKDPSKWVLSGLAQIIPAIYAVSMALSES